MTTRALVIGAAGLVLLQLAIAVVWSEIYAELWAPAMLMIGILWMIGLVLTVAGAWEAATRPAPLAERAVLGLATPAILVLGIVLSGPATWLGYRLRAEWMLRHDPAVLTAAAGQPMPKAFTILEGIPDGGIALIHAAQDPRRWDQPRAVRIVGERIRHCIAIRPAWFVCSYD